MLTWTHSTEITKAAKSDRTQWEDYTIVASFFFVQINFNYNPADAERCIRDKLDTESKSGSVNMTARCLILRGERERERERERVVAVRSIKLIATLRSTLICRPRNMDTDQESNEYRAPPSNMSRVDSFILSRLQKLATCTTEQWKVISKENNLSPLMQNGSSRTLFVNSSPSHDS